MLHSCRAQLRNQDKDLQIFWHLPAPKVERHLQGLIKFNYLKEKILKKLYASSYKEATYITMRSTTQQRFQ